MLEEYVAPFWQIEIGPWEVRRMVEYRVERSLNPIDLAEIVLPLDAGNEITAGMPVVIKAGYRERGLRLVFHGKVQQVVPGRITKVRCRDAMADLTEGKMQCWFAAATPQEVMGFVLNAKGVGKHQLAGGSYPKRPFAAWDISALEIIKEVNQSWSLQHPFWFDLSGLFFWGNTESSSIYQNPPVLVLEYGVNILEHHVESSTGMGVLKTILLPELVPASRVKIRDPRLFAGELEALIHKVKLIHDRSAARMVVEWKPTKN